MRKLGTGFAVIIVIVGILLLGFYFKKEEEKSLREEQHHAMMEKELNPLSVRKREVERRLRQLDEEKEDKLQIKGSTVLLFVDAKEEVYKSAYPIMKQYGYQGVLLLTRDSYPGAEGCMTKEQFDELLLEGWTYCVKWEKADSVSKWNKTVEKQLLDLSLEKTSCVYFELETYSKDYKEALKKVGYDTVIHCGDEKLPLITSEVKEPMWFPGSYGMNGQAPRNYLNDAMSVGGSIVYRIGFEKTEEMYDEKTFESMLKWMKRYEDEERLQVLDLKDAYDYHKKLTQRRNKAENSMSEEEKALREEMISLEEQIDAVYKKYLNIQGHEGWETTDGE